MGKKKPDILLVNPACLDRRVFGEDDRIVPIGLYYIAALALKNGFDTRILNLADIGDEEPVAVFTKAIQSWMPDVIGFSVMNPNRWNAIDCARVAKRIRPDGVIVFGGPAPGFMPGHFFSVCPEIDVVVKGEGELSFLDILNSLEACPDGPLDHIPGLILKRDGVIVETQARAPLEDLDTLPHPSEYFRFAHLSMSRGCPGACTFCGSPGFWGARKVRSHSAHWFAHEIETLYQKGVRHFYISDDTFTMDKPRVLEFCRRISEKHLNITWNAISRADCVDEDLLLAMRKAGCIQISYGVESGSESIRKTLGKPVDRETIIQAFSLTKACGILSRAYFIYGSPGETKKTIQESLDLMLAIGPLSIICYLLVVFPGTYLYERAKRKNLVTDDLWEKRMEDLPWFEVDERLDFDQVKTFGDRLRSAFYGHVDQFALGLELLDKKELYPFHADFLSRLGMTFSHGEYAGDSRVKNPDKTATRLFEQALAYAPDARAFLGLAMQSQRLRHFDKAMAILEMAFTYFPDHKDLNLCMGICLMNKGEWRKALAVFEPFSNAPEFKNYIDICRKHG